MSWPEAIYYSVAAICVASVLVAMINRGNK